VPSIIYGIWGSVRVRAAVRGHVQPHLQTLFGDVPVIGGWFAGPPIGVGILTAGIVLSLMVIPFVASVMRDVFRNRAAATQGIGLWCRLHHLGSGHRCGLPYTRVGVIGGIMLGLGRALGETMAVTFVIGNANRIVGSLFAPGTSIASTLANEFGEADPGLHISALFALGLVLFIITFIVLAISRWLIGAVSPGKAMRR
jgi:phosphate transport system permease protein